jgi:hypothetical protein
MAQLGQNELQIQQNNWRPNLSIHIWFALMSDKTDAAEK